MEVGSEWKAKGRKTNTEMETCYKKTEKQRVKREKLTNNNIKEHGEIKLDAWTTSVEKHEK